MSSATPSYLLCNWNDRALAVVIQLRSKLLRAQGEAPIHVVDPCPPALDEFPPAYAEFLRGVSFTRGHPGDPTVLASLDLAPVTCAILLPSSDDAQCADAETLLTLEGLRCARRKAGSSLRALVEVVDPAHRCYLDRLIKEGDDWVEVLKSREVEAHVFSQTLRVRGLAKMYFDLLSFSASTNEVYRVPVGDELVGAPFSEAFESTRASTAGRPRQLPVGVARGGGTRIETNPDDDRPLAAGDELVVLSFEPPNRGASGRPQER